MENNETSQDLQNSELALNELLKKRTDLTLLKRDYEIELMALNRRVISSIQRLPPMEYKAICGKQITIKKKIHEIEKETVGLRTEIRDRNIYIDKLKKSLEVGFWDKKQQSRDSDTSDTVITRITNLRNTYMEFASDPTRVSSLRTMAARFAEELEALIQSA